MRSSTSKTSMCQVRGKCQWRRKTPDYPQWEVPSSESGMSREGRVKVGNEQMISPLGSSLPRWCYSRKHTIVSSQAWLTPTHSLRSVGDAVFKRKGPPCWCHWLTAPRGHPTCRSIQTGGLVLLFIFPPESLHRPSACLQVTESRTLWSAGLDINLVGHARVEISCMVSEDGFSELEGVGISLPSLQTFQSQQAQKTKLVSCKDTGHLFRYEHVMTHFTPMFSNSTFSLNQTVFEK